MTSLRSAAAALALAALGTLPPVSAWPPGAAPLALAVGLRLCTLGTDDTAWAKAWTARLPPALRRRVPTQALGAQALSRPHPCGGGLLVGLAAPELGAPGDGRLTVAYAGAGYLAGAALGAALPTDGTLTTARVAGPLAPTPSNEALLAGLAQGLAAAAPAGTRLAVGGRAGAADVAVAIDSRSPAALVTWRKGETRGRCMVDEDALAAVLARRLTGHVATTAAPQVFRCALAPPDDATAAALAAARSRLAQGLVPDALPSFTRPPLAVAPWQRATQPQRPARRDRRRR